MNTAHFIPPNVEPIALYQGISAMALGGNYTRELLAIWPEGVVGTATFSEGVLSAESVLLMEAGFDVEIGKFLSQKRGLRQDCQEELRHIDGTKRFSARRNILISKPHDFVLFGFDWCDERDAFWAILSTFKSSIADDSAPGSIGPPVDDLLDQWIDLCS